MSSVSTKICVLNDVMGESSPFKDTFPDYNLNPVPRLQNNVRIDDAHWKWESFGPFVKFGPHVYKVCLTSWGAKRLVKRYTKKGKIPW